MRRGLGLVTAIGLAACGGPGDGPMTGSGAGAGTPRGGDGAPELLALEPDSFVVLPCVGASRDSACAIVSAGGKSLVFGAPEGVSGALAIAGVTEPDAVFLLSLEGGGVEGLLRLRNKTWLDGRQVNLAVAGPEGTASLLFHLDKALERSDPLSYMRHGRGAYGSALFATLEVTGSAPMTVFDSGDLNVMAVSQPVGLVSYAVSYGGTTLGLHPCPLPGAAPLAGLETDVTIGCGDEPASIATWPLGGPGIRLGDVQSDQTLP